MSWTQTTSLQGRPCFADRSGMATHKQLPERYPVIEHMEDRLRAQGRLAPDGSVRPGPPASSGHGLTAGRAFVLGLVIGLVILGVLWLPTSL